MLRELKTLQGLLALLPLIVALAACADRQGGTDAKAQEAAYREKYAKAEALFKERCKTAGVVIKRTVKDVEGIELRKVRPKLEWGDKRYFDPMFEGAALAAEPGGDEYLKRFLLSKIRLIDAPEERDALVRPERQPGLRELPSWRGYRYVEIVDPLEGKRYRVTLPWDPTQVNINGQVQREISTGSPPRYALDQLDIVDPADRAYWIAGTQLRAIDQQTGEVLGQLTRYVFDPGFGSGAAGVWPWQYASRTECPSIPGEPIGHTTHRFVQTVLIPKQVD